MELSLSQLDRIRQRWEGLRLRIARTSCGRNCQEAGWGVFDCALFAAQGAHGIDRCGAACGQVSAEFSLCNTARSSLT
jgi:hypothetical protein